MPLNIVDIEDAFLLGQAQWEEFIFEAGQAFYGPMVERTVGALWSFMDEPSKQALQMQSPDTYEWLTKKFGEPEKEEQDYADFT